MTSVYFDLLRQWCDEMLRLQLHDLGPEFDGGLICPACRYQHGRCGDAVYPFMYMADRTGERKYVEAAKAVVDWHERSMLADDDSAYNDTHAAWNGITVFAATALCEALDRHASLLDLETKARWEAKLVRMARWLYANLNENMGTNINYLATNAAALALIGRHLDNGDYLRQSRHLAWHALERFTENGLLYGEGHPRDVITARGCRAVDIGYNVEESVPSLVKYALATGDEAALAQLTDVLKKQLDFMLPDGGWDNSFGSRNNKWTYYGSRTSDGCQSAYALLADRDPAFAEAARRNTELMRRASSGGLLRGGPQYAEYGEPACIHHTFTHANALTAALDAGIEAKQTGAPLPGDAPEVPVRYYPEIATYKLAVGRTRATVTAYDYDLSAGHASGGSLTLLWHAATGPVIAGSVVDYQLVEAVNQQLSLKKKRHRSLVPRLELWRDGVRYAQCYDTAATLTASGDAGEARVGARARLVSIDQRPLGDPVDAALNYAIRDDSATISACVYGAAAGEVRLILPVICGKVRIEAGTLESQERIFFLTGGFGAEEYVIAPDARGEVRARIGFA